MRARSRSYGESSTRTRSPGRMRIRKRRIFPATWPRTTRSMLSSFTRNIAFGRASTTSPSSSTFSSFGIYGCRKSSGYPGPSTKSDPSWRTVARTDRQPQERGHEANPASDRCPQGVAAAAQDASLPDADARAGRRLDAARQVQGPGDSVLGVGGPDLHDVLERPDNVLRPDQFRHR